MTCPKCDGELIPSKVGKLCLNCGELFKGRVLKAKAKIAEKKPAAKPKSAKKVTIKTKKPRGPVADDAPIPHIPAGDDDQPPVHTIPVAQLAELSPPRRFPIKLVVALSLGVIFFGALVTWYVLVLKSGPAGLINRLVSKKTASLRGKVSFKGDDVLSIFNSNVNYLGVIDISDATHPKIATHVTGKIATKDYTADSQIDGNKWYLKLEGTDLPILRYKQSSYLYKVTNSWQRFNIGPDLFNNYCEVRADHEKVDALAVYKLTRELKVHPDLITLPVGFIAGGVAWHSSGTIDNKNLPDLITGFNAAIPPGCGWPFPGDAANWQVRYDLWRGFGGDKLGLVIRDKQLGTEFRIDLQLDNYGAQVEPVVPTDFTDVSATQQVAKAILTRDDKRRTDIGAINTALQDYFTDTKKYPAQLSELAPKYLKVVPTDPRSGQGYDYVVTAGSQKSSLTAHLEEAVSGDYTVTNP